MLYLVKAVSIAKENPRYHFLVYNASVFILAFLSSIFKASLSSVFSEESSSDCESFR